MANDSAASVTPSPMYDWRSIAERSIRYHRSFRPVRGMLPGDDEMYNMLVGNAPVQHYTVGMTPVTQLSSTKSINSSSTAVDNNYVLFSLWVWCCLIVISGIVAFTTTLFVLLQLDLNDADTTTALDTQDSFFASSITPSPSRPPIVDPFFTTLQNDTDYAAIS